MSSCWHTHTEYYFKWREGFEEKDFETHTSVGGTILKTKYAQTAFIYLIIGKILYYFETERERERDIIFIRFKDLFVGGTHTHKITLR